MDKRVCSITGQDYYVHVRNDGSEIACETWADLLYQWWNDETMSDEMIQEEEKMKREIEEEKKYGWLEQIEKKLSK